MSTTTTKTSTHYFTATVTEDTGTRLVEVTDGQRIYQARVVEDFGGLRIGRWITAIPTSHGVSEALAALKRG